MCSDPGFTWDVAPQTIGVSAFGSEGGRLADQRMGLQSWLGGALKQTPTQERLEVRVAGEWT